MQICLKRTSEDECQFCTAQGICLRVSLLRWADLFHKNCTSCKRVQYLKVNSEVEQTRIHNP